MTPRWWACWTASATSSKSSRRARAARAAARSQCSVIGDALDVVHHEVGQTVRRAAGVEDARDAGVIGALQRAPLDVEARRELGVVRRRGHDLERHAPAHRLVLLGQEDLPRAALADALEHPVGTDAPRAARPAPRARRARAGSAPPP